MASDSWPAMEQYDGKKRQVIDCPGCARDYSNDDDGDPEGYGILRYLQELDEEDDGYGYGYGGYY